MMNNPYSLHSWSKDYRAQVMDTARRRDLIERARRETHRSSGVWTSRRQRKAPFCDHLADWDDSDREHGKGKTWREGCKV
jgi:hypothetical protein